jgi:hypothetical protein
MADRLESALSRLNSARAILLAPLLRKIVGASWAISFESPMFLRLNSSMKGPRRNCVLPDMEGDDRNLLGMGLCSDTSFFPASSYAEQIFVEFDPRGIIFHVYPAAAAGELSQALVGYGAAIGAQIGIPDIVEISTRSGPLAYVALERQDRVCVLFYQLMVPKNPFGAATLHSLSGTFCQRSDGDSKAVIEENVLGMLTKIELVPIQ